MADENTKPAGEQTQPDALQALQNQVNDLVKEWAEFKTAAMKRLDELANKGGLPVEHFDLFARGVVSDQARVREMLRIGLQQSLILSAVCTQIWGNAVSGDIRELQAKLNANTQALNDAVEALTPPEDPAVDAARKAGV